MTIMRISLLGLTVFGILCYGYSGGFGDSLGVARFPGTNEPSFSIDEESAVHRWFTNLRRHRFHVKSLSYRSQAEIDHHTLNVRKNESGTNESVIYSPLEDAAAIRIRSSLPQYNTVELKFPPVSTGELVCVWQYKPAGGWKGNDGNIRTHKMFMLGSKAVKDRRTLEQRFHYLESEDGKWRIDTRPYSLGVEIGLLGRIEPYQVTFAPTDTWLSFLASVDFNALVPEYSLKMFVDGEGAEIYDSVPLNDLLRSKKSLDFFSPTWVNTSQSAGKQGERIHGWLRNVVVLWNPDGKVGLESLP